MALAVAARPRRVADDDVGLRIVGRDREEVAVVQRLPVERGEDPATCHEPADVRRPDLFEQRDVQREDGYADGAAVHVPAPHPHEEPDQVGPGNRRAAASGLASMFAEALEQTHQEDARAAGRVEKTPAVPGCGRKPVPDLGDHGVGEEHRRVVGAAGVTLGGPLGEEPVVDGADQLDGDVLEVVLPESVLSDAPVHRLAAGPKTGQDPQVRRVEARTAFVRLERAGRDEQVAVEVLPQGSEEMLQRLAVPGVQQRFERLGVRACGVPKVLRVDDLPILEIGDERRLHEQRLRRLGRQTGIAEQAMRLGEVVEKNAVDAFSRVEVLAVLLLLPEAARFGGVGEVPERQRVGDGIQFVDEAPVEVVVPGAWRSTQREEADRLSGDDHEQARETLVPERGVQGRGSSLLVLADQDRDGRHVFDAEDRRQAQVVERRAQRAGMGRVPDLFRLFVEFRRPAGGEAQAGFPRGVRRLRGDGFHHGSPSTGRPPSTAVAVTGRHGHRRSRSGGRGRFEPPMTPL